MKMTPPQAHWHVCVLSRAGMLPISVLAAPALHGPVVIGMQGWGVSTPIAADVAAATCGLASDMHMPNGMMFVIGTKSMIVAAGTTLAFVRLMGSTTKVDGAAPKGHCSMAPWTTWSGIAKDSAA